VCALRALHWLRCSKLSSNIVHYRYACCVAPTLHKMIKLKGLRGHPLRPCCIGLRGHAPSSSRMFQWIVPRCPPWHCSAYYRNFVRSVRYAVSIIALLSQPPVSYPLISPPSIFCPLCSLLDHPCMNSSLTRNYSINASCIAPLWTLHPASRPLWGVV